MPQAKCPCFVYSYCHSNAELQCKSKNRWIYIALYYKSFISKALRYGPCVTRGSHSFTCHSHTNHTCLTPSHKVSPPSGWYSLCLPTNGWPGWLYLGGWSHTEINVPHWELNPDTVSQCIILFAQLVVSAIQTFPCSSYTCSVYVFKVYQTNEQIIKQMPFFSYYTVLSIHYPSNSVTVTSNSTCVQDPETWLTVLSAEGQKSGHQPVIGCTSLILGYCCLPHNSSRTFPKKQKQNFLSVVNRSTTL